MIAQRNAANIGQGRAPGQTRLPFGFQDHLAAGVDTEYARAARCGPLHPAAGSASRIEDAAAIELAYSPGQDTHFKSEKRVGRVVIRRRPNAIPVNRINS